jgi:regulator of protease activity HflC (stomatin/prohibitin superfamily)
MIRGLVLSSLVLGACSYARVGSGEVAIVRTPEGVAKRVYPPGDWRIGGDDHAIKYNARSQERPEELHVQASDGLGITLEMSIRYHIVASEAVALDQELGEDYYGILIGPTLRSQARRVVGRFKPEEIYSTQLVRNVRLPEQIELAINNKLEAEQAALKMQFVLAQQEAENQKQLMEAKAEAERQRISADSSAEAARQQAQGTADATRITAQADADAKRLDAQATADYDKLLQPHLTPAILRALEIEATSALARSPNSKLVLGGGTHSLLDLRSLP